MIVTSNPSLNQAEASLKNPDQVAVLLTGYGGIENYKDFTTYNRRASDYIAAKFAPIPHWLYPLVARILTFHDLYKWGYKHHHFTSPQNEIFEKQRAGIEKCLQERWGERVRVFKAFYFCEPFVEQVLAEIKAQGFNKLLIYPLLVVNSVFTSTIAAEQVNQAIDNLTQGQEDWLTDIRYIPSFATQPNYINLMAHQVEETIANDLANDFLPSQIGLVLMCHGSPNKTKGLVTGLQEGQELFNQVELQMIDHYPLISIGWINHHTPFLKWTEPNLKKAAKNLIELGAKVLVFKPLGWATDNIETILDVEEAIESVRRKHPDITYVKMGCANDQPEFLKMAAEWASPQIDALFSSSGFCKTSALKNSTQS